MVVGVLLGRLGPGAVGTPRGLEFGDGSRINVPIVVLIGLMIYPMMLRIDVTSLIGVLKGCFGAGAWWSLVSQDARVTPMCRRRNIIPCI
jgi:ACR3 family arsenite efflux pump ArsB